MNRLSRDYNTRGYKIEEKDGQYTIDGDTATVEEILQRISDRPYWATREFNIDQYRGLIINNTSIIRLIKIDDTYRETLRTCIKDNRLLYYVKIRHYDDDVYADSIAMLDFDSMPMHETWAKGTQWPDKEYKVPSLNYDIDRSKPLSKMVGCFIDGEMKCPKCSKPMSSMSGYTLHLKSCKAKPATEDGVIYTCAICGKKTISKFGLTNHMRTAHQGAK